MAQQFYKNGFEFANEAQLVWYMVYQESKHIPVFVAIGVSNAGSKPDHLFIVLLAEIDATFLPLTLLKNMKKWQ